MKNSWKRIRLKMMLKKVKTELVLKSIVPIERVVSLPFSKIIAIAVEKRLHIELVKVPLKLWISTKMTLETSIRSSTKNAKSRSHDRINGR